MVKSRDAFSWRDGNTPECPVHSRIKLEILRSYLLAYFPTITANRRMDYVNIEMVDAFAGGGTLIDSETKTPISGSPIVMMNTVREAELAIAAEKTKPFKINARYHFADACPSAVQRLRCSIANSRFGSDLVSGRIQIDQLAFDDFLPTVLQRIGSHPRKKVIFFLDQCGWNRATLSHCNQVLAQLPKAEIIWNISVESLAQFANTRDSFRDATKRFGVDLGDALSAWQDAERLRDWRKSLVALYLREIKAKCRAKFISPFMIQHKGWGYWLLHLSNHQQANDVMKVTHWKHQNHSLHEGFPGIRMLEFNRENWNQTSIFRFDREAETATHEALVTELGPKIRELGEAPTVQTLIHAVANETPADRKRIFSALDVLRAEGEYRIVGPKGERRQRAPKTLDDRLLRVPARPVFLTGWN